MRPVRCCPKYFCTAITAYCVSWLKMPSTGPGSKWRSFMRCWYAETTIPRLPQLSPLPGEGRLASFGCVSGGIVVVVVVGRRVVAVCFVAGAFDAPGLAALAEVASGRSATTYAAPLATATRATTAIVSSSRRCDPRRRRRRRSARDDSGSGSEGSTGPRCYRRKRPKPRLARLRLVSRLRLFFDQRGDRGVGDGDTTEVEQEVDNFGRGDQVAAREALQRFIDDVHKPGLVHVAPPGATVEAAYPLLSTLQLNAPYGEKVPGE